MGGRTSSVGTVVGQSSGVDGDVIVVGVGSTVAEGVVVGSSVTVAVAVAVGSVAVGSGVGEAVGQRVAVAVWLGTAVGDGNGVAVVCGTAVEIWAGMRASCGGREQPDQTKRPIIVTMPKTAVP